MPLKLSILCVFLLLLSQYGASQEIKPCSTDELYEELLQNDLSGRDEILRAKARLDSLSISYQKNRITNKTDSIYIIPVVFHVLHQGGTENISDEQIKDVVRVVNEDFRRMNSDTNITLDAFKPIAADTKIEIRLAKKDPNGNCTNGIDRIYTDRTYAASDSSKLNQWPRDMYLNVWVVASIGSGAAGYAYYPYSTTGTRSVKDGIVVLSHYVGSIGTSDLNRSRTLTHEIGHYLNLTHTWGSSNSPGVASNCNIDDGVFDTPLTMGHTSCNLSARTCDGTLDNVQNYMEYSYCTNMFTYGQAARMRAALNSNIAGRNNLHSHQNLLATGVLEPGNICDADFESNLRYACVSDTVIFIDKSYHNPQNWLWNLEGTKQLFFTDSVIQTTYPYNGVFDAYLMVSDSTGSVVEAKTDYIYIFDTIADFDTMGYVQNFENTSIPNEWHAVENPFGDRFELAPVGYRSPSSIFVNNYGDTANSEKYVLISPSFDFTNIQNAKLKFKYAYASRNSNNSDKFEVYISKDCGKSWQIKFTYFGNFLSTVSSPISNQAFVPDSSNKWKGFTIPLNPLPQPANNILIKFVFSTGGGNNFYLDDVEVDGVVGTEELENEIQARIYPNPTNEHIYIELDLQWTDDIRIELFNIQGQKIRDLKTEKIPAGRHLLDFDVQDLPNGMFFVKIYKSGQLFTTRKLIIQ